ncbi:MAG: 3-deoxy-D-manno-octulosonic acid transferase [Planctomycetota bacterium]
MSGDAATGARAPLEPPRSRSRPHAALTMALYQLVFLIGFCCYLPVLLWRAVFDARYRRGFRQRMGGVRIERRSAAVVWIHGVSVGEIKAATNIIARLRQDRPDLQIVLSSTTPNGHQVARQEHGDLEVVFYPLDFGPFPGRALDRVRPQCVLLMELEIWPNFLQAAASRRIPVAVINGRISESTYRGYRRARGLLPQLDSIHLYCVQDAAYQKRLLDLGVDPRRVFVTGNMKYDSVVMGQAPPGDTLRGWLAPDDRIVLVAGSTHADEEAWLCEAVAPIGPPGGSASGPRVRLVLVPRHPERAGSVCDAVRQAGRVAVRWSETDEGARSLRRDAVLVVDTIGQLQRFYAACDIAFVGGSLVPHGGQNMLEPAAQGRAVVFGPHTFNFRTDVELLLRAEAAVQVADREQLAACLAELCRRVDLRDALGERARAVIRANQGATQRTLDHIGQLLGAPVADSVP